LDCGSSSLPIFGESRHELTVCEPTVIINTAEWLTVKALWKWQHPKCIRLWYFPLKYTLVIQWKHLRLL